MGKTFQDFAHGVIIAHFLQPLLVPGTFDLLLKLMIFDLLEGEMSSEVVGENQIALERELESLVELKNLHERFTGDYVCVCVR